MWRTLLLLMIVFLPAPSFAQPLPDVGAAIEEAEAQSPAESHAAATAMGSEMNLLWVLPFVTLLLAIALFPLFAEHWWENNLNKGIVVAVVAIPVIIYLVGEWGTPGIHELMEKSKEYTSFIVLLGSLFVISGGIYLHGSLSGTPLGNTSFLALGAVLANLIGTTGASMLLIRPLLRANESRARKAHIVIFFIFVVSNCGGLLTPLGDPPLFLGFLTGVPFEWTFRLFLPWLMVNGLLLMIFHIWDEMTLGKEERARPGSQLEEAMIHEPMKLHGWHNSIFLFGIVATIYFSGSGLGYGGQPWPFPVPELIMVALTGLAYLSTRRDFRVNNRFTFGPIVEVAVLFAGIFVTMAPALLILNAWGNGEREVLGMPLALSQPWQYFWATGMLSSFLDNAPTYLTMAVTASGMQGVVAEGRYLETFLSSGAAADRLLQAISCGAVFMGANTYIGNGPNFMVRAIAESSGVRMPGFFGYMVYSGAILLPIFVLVTVVFFRS